MPALITTRAFPYAGRHLQSGERFEASESDARLLKLLQWAVEPEPVKPKRHYRRRDLRAEP